ncbi:MAG: trypsin-like peptidase domain-containing protein [Planctomycetaceae bacterium]|nr:trypsin-like peptidase domain-containing protein [Planctomycetales bacterium]MCB9924001.1 trypsin-like peptidase domain-containing protein [Planctomycetaceae bacterium]
MQEFHREAPDMHLHEPSNDQREAATRTANRLSWFLAALTALLLVRFLVPYLAEQIQYSVTRGQQRAELEAAKEGLKQLPLRELSTAYQLVSKRVAPSVVHINVASTLVRGGVVPMDPRFQQLHPEARGQGSGVIVDREGYIVTNNHVVTDATEIQVTLSDGRVVTGEVVGIDALTDLAVLKIEAADLEAAEWGDSDRLDAGALVWAVGSPFGLQHSITFGIVSAKHRSSGTAWQDFLQTDAAVNPGNSGGPLVDVNGNIVGINTAIVGEAYQGISFAIPSSIAKQVYENLRTSGRVERGWLGAQLGDVTDEVAREFNLTVTRGAYIVAVVTTDPRNPSPAQRAGIRPGDIVVRWNERDITDGATLTRLVAAATIGSDVEVVIVREGREVTLTVNIDERPLQIN